QTLLKDAGEGDDPANPELVSASPERSADPEAEPTDDPTADGKDGLAPDNSDSSDAIDDLDFKSAADRAKTISYRYQRDLLVRVKGKSRANGLYEYCGTRGFLDVNGQAYLECHHIIALADQGADKTSNVIALCPDHPREAHFGQRAEELERNMTFI